MNTHTVNSHRYTGNIFSWHSSAASFDFSDYNDDNKYNDKAMLHNKVQRSAYYRPLPTHLRATNLLLPLQQPLLQCLFCVNLITCFVEVASQISCHFKQDALRFGWVCMCALRMRGDLHQRCPEWQLNDFSYSISRETSFRKVTLQTSRRLFQ